LSPLGSVPTPCQWLWCKWAACAPTKQVHLNPGLWGAHGPEQFQVQVPLTVNSAFMWHSQPVIFLRQAQNCAIKKVGLGAGGSCCNPSYSGGRNQEDCTSEPALSK
jgi:hypothetical protein